MINSLGLSDAYMHLYCVSEIIVIGSDDGLLPGWRQTIIWTNAGIDSFHRCGHR